MKNIFNNTSILAKALLLALCFAPAALADSVDELRINAMPVGTTFTVIRDIVVEANTEQSQLGETIDRTRCMFYLGNESIKNRVLKAGQKLKVTEVLTGSSSYHDNLRLQTASKKTVGVYCETWGYKIGDLKEGIKNYFSVSLPANYNPEEI